MKTIQSKNIVSQIRQLCIDVNTQLAKDTYDKIKEMQSKETSNVGKHILDQIIENADLAAEKKDPICQDTGMAVFFVELGQEVIIEGQTLEESINEGVRQGYKDGYLRKSVVKDPIRRENTNDNTPAIIYIETKKGNQLKIKFAPKGFGSENMSRLKMLKPADGLEGVEAFVMETIEKAGPNPCPPIVIGVGIGGTMDKACQIAKKALFRKTGQHSTDPYLADLEKKWIKKINEMQIGPQGLGGDTTALAIHIETYPTHIAGLPVAVNINCHASRHGEITL